MHVHMRPLTQTENLLVTADGRVKIIDFGAAADMSTGVNFNPL